MTVNDSAQASDGFGVVSTPVPAEPAVSVLGRITPAEPIRRKASGQMHYPGGVIVGHFGIRPAGDRRVIYLDHFGWMTRETAAQVAASLAGAVAEVQRQEAREAGRG